MRDLSGSSSGARKSVLDACIQITVPPFWFGRLVPLEIQLKLSFASSRRAGGQKAVQIILRRGLFRERLAAGTMQVFVSF